MKIKILADSTCDLPEELLKKHDIRIIPLSIYAGETVHKDGVDIMPYDIFEYVNSGKGICKTSAVNVGEYIDVYEEERPKCDGIIHFTISAEMSSCYQNARVAIDEFSDIYLIDTRNLSCAIGHLVLDAAKMATTGTHPKEINEEMNKRIELLDASFVIDSLTYLHKGGRCSSLAAIASSALKIRPCLNVVDGKIVVGKKYRGKSEVVLRKYIEDRLADKENIDPRRIIIPHTMTKENMHLVDMAVALVKELLPFEEILTTTAGGTISCHCGPNTLGLFFYRKA
ncbi:MAG: DegV family protein [Defluviitaleaceae bacterium]|nr:DegV family protein [Defluviitaleaceae bacterium]